MALTRPARDLMLWLSAVDREVLARCPGETTRFVGAGGTVAFTTAMAALAGAFTAHSLMHLGTPAAIAFGLVWSLGIMNLERYVQATIRRQATVARTVLQAAPRLMLAIALGLVISKPLMLRIFQPEVRAQVAVDKDAKRSAAQRALERQYSQVLTLKSTIKHLEQALTSPPSVGLVLGESPEYHALAKRYGTFLAQARAATTPRTARAYEHAAAATLQQMEPLRTELLQKEAEDNRNRNSDQRAQLATARTALAPLQRQFNARTEELTHRYEAPSGLADEAQALSVLEHHSSAIATEARLWWLFIIAVDMLPALMKTLMCVGRRTQLEEFQEALENASVASVKASADRRVKEGDLAESEQYELQSRLSKARLEEQFTAQREMDETSIHTLRETIRPHVERWARVTAEQYAKALAEEAVESPTTLRNRRARDEHRERRASVTDAASRSDPPASASGRRR